MADKNDLKKTLNLPQTSFAMKAQLVLKEPEIQKNGKKSIFTINYSQPAGPAGLHSS